MTDFRALCAELLNGLVEQQHPDYPWPGYTLAAMDRARAALAKQPVGPTKAEIHSLADDILDGDRASRVDFARAVLARWGQPAVTPIPVAERLPGPEDCLDEGWAWFFNQRIGWRQAVLPVSPGFSHWLPATALPVPGAEESC